VEELVMRLRALVRRSRGHGDARIVCGPISFDAQVGTFERDGLPLKLTALEWRVLSCLMLRKEIVVARADLIERVYEGDADVDSNSVEVIIARLRRKIGHAMIETSRGLGYRLTAEGTAR
jgi:DNA-binding response OmpR family regulator